MRRREFVTLLGGGDVAACGAGAAERADAADRRAHEQAAADVEGQVRIAAFLQGWLDSTL